MEHEIEASVSKAVAVIACVFMTLLDVAILYAPTLILRLPPPSSLEYYLIQRFICAAISSTVSLIFSTFILSWQAVVFPLFLTSLMYTGCLVLKSMLSNAWTTNMNGGGELSLDFIKSLLQTFLGQMLSIASNAMAWRNYFVAPLTEELVIRACMIHLLLCGGFKIYTVIFLCPIFFNLFNRSFEPFNGDLQFTKLELVQSLYDCWSSTWLHRGFWLVCFFSVHLNRLVSVVFVTGMLSFFWLLFLITLPDLYNDRTNNCRCWHGYCSWN